MNRIKYLLITFFILFGSFSDLSAQAFGDYRSVASGVWGNASTWQKWTGSWVAAGSAPAAVNNVTILIGHIVTLTGLGACKDLTVDVGGQLYTNSTSTNIYISVSGNIVCNGIIGNGVTFDALSFNIESINCTITGTGAFDASRMRKSAITNLTTNLFINRDVRLRFGGGKQTQIYNNAPSAAKFNITVGAGATLLLDSTISASCGGSVGAAASTTVTTNTSFPIYSSSFIPTTSMPGCRVFGTGIAPGATVVLIGGLTPNFTLTLSLPNTGPVSGILQFISDGNAAIDGTNGADGSALAGNVTINGTMIVSGLLYLTNNNVALGDSVNWTVNSGGLLKVGNVSMAASGTSRNILRVKSGGKFEINGLPGFTGAYITTNNTYDYQTGSFEEFSGKGNQNVPVSNASATYYGNLKISGTGTKATISTPLGILNNLDIVNTSGTPVLDASSAAISLVGGNWTNYDETAFTEATNLVRFNGAALQTINCTGGEVFYNVNYNKSAPTNLQLNSKVSIKNTLNWNNDGAIDLNGNTLVMRSNAITAISGGTANRYIMAEKTDFSSIVKWYIGTAGSLLNYGIPFSTAPGITNAAPFGVSVGAGINADTLVVSTYGTPGTNLPWPTTPVAITNLTSAIGLMPDNRDATADRFWYVKFTAATMPAVDIALSYASVPELPIAPWNTATSMQAQYWDNALSQWSLPVLGSATLNVVTISNPPINGVWTLVNNASPLPIELLQFSGHYINNISYLNWTTLSEIDNDYFVVERSNNGSDFYTVGRVKGAGTSRNILNYDLKDFLPIEKIAYYRLKQVDFNGNFSFSNIIALKSNKLMGEQNISIYPQPGTGTFTVIQNVFEEGESFYSEVFNMQGSLIKKDLHSSTENSNLLLNLNDLSTGMYMLRLSNGVKQLSKPLIIE